jgi:DNA repair exonuclease SbcCD nuclease subunit
MKRTKKENKLSVDCLLTADWHLRSSQPTCRTDDFWNAQWDVVRQVSKLQRRYNCPVLHAGDLFDHWKPSPRLLSQAIKFLPDQFYTVYGNHDVPQHSLDLIEKTGIYTLMIGGHINVLSGSHFDQIPSDPSMIFPSGDREVVVWHEYVYTGKAPFPGAEKEAKGNWALDKYDKFDLILTGDNHIPFVCRDEGRILVNAGSLTRQSAKQINYRPRVWLYNARKNKVKPHYLDVPKDVISREHIEEKEERDDRITAFVERLGTKWEGELDFEKNLKTFYQKNDINKEIKDITYSALEA